MSRCRTKAGKFKKCRGRAARGPAERRRYKGIPVISRNKVWAQKINAGHDTNGNPRRGWYVHDRSGKFLGFVDEGYGGRSALLSVFPNAQEASMTIAATPGEYRSAKKARLLAY